MDCGFTLFRNKGGKELSDKQLAELLTKGRTGVIKGFRSREGKAFDASLVLRPDFSVGYELPTRNHPKANLPRNDPPDINSDLKRDEVGLDVP